MGSFDREGEGAKEIAAIDFQGFERNGVVIGWDGVRILNTAEGGAHVLDNFAILNFGFALAAEVGDFPAFEIFAVKKFLAVGGFGGGDCCDEQDGGKQRKKS